MKQMTQMRYRDWFSRTVLWNTQCKSCGALNTAVTVGGFANAQLLWKLGQRGFKKHIWKFRDTKLLCLFFFLRNCDSEICVQSHMASLWWNQTFHFQESAFLEPWKSKNIESCTITVNSFKKRNTISNLEGFWKAGSEEVLIYIVQKWLQWWRHHALVLVPLCCYILFTYQLNFSFFLFRSVQPSSSWNSRLDWR